MRQARQKELFTSLTETIVMLRREAACPCCKDGKTLLGEPCQECHGKGLAIVAYDSLRIHYKSLQEYADNLKDALSDALEVTDICRKWLREGEPRTAENEDAAKACDEALAYAASLGVVPTSQQLATPSPNATA